MKHLKGAANKKKHSLKGEKGSEVSGKEIEALFNLIPDPAVIIDSKGRILSVNDAVTQRIGFSRDELLGKNFLRTKIITAKSKAIAISNLAKRMMGTPIPPYELEIQTKDGEKGWGEVNATRISYEGKPAILIIFRDVTERKNMEEMLKEKEERHRLMFENMGSAVAVYEVVDNGRDFIFKDFNSAAERIDKIKREKLIGKSVLKVFPEVKGFGLFEVFQRVWKTGKPEHHPATMYKDQRITGWRENYVYKLRSNEVVAVYEDITELKNAENAVRESEEFSSSLLENSPTSILVVNLDGSIRYANPAMQKLTGYPPSETIGRKPPYPWWPKEEIEKLSQKLKIRYKENIRRYEECLQKKNGEYFWVEINPSPIMHDGQLKYYVSIWVDITHRKQMETELENSLSTLRATLESTADGILVVDNDEKITDFNQQYIKIFQIPESVLSSRDDRRVVSFLKDQLKDPEGFANRTRELFAQPDLERSDLLEFKNGRILERYSRPQCVRGKTVGRVVSFRDMTERKRLEDKLRTSSQFFESIFDDIPESIIIKDCDSKHLMVNQAYCDFYNQRKDEIIGKTDNELFSKEEAEVFRKQDQEVIKKGITVDIPEANVTDAAGTTHILHMKKAPLKSINGKVTHVINVSRVITDIKKAEAALRASEEFSSSLLENSLTPILVVNPDSSIRYVNPALEKLSGFSRSELVGTKPPFPWWCKELIKETTTRLEDNMRRGLAHYEERLRRKNGEDFWVEVNAALTEKDGLVKHYLSSWVDITERKRVEEALRESEQFSFSLLNNSTYPIIVIKSDTSIRFVNPALEKLTGYSSSELIGEKPPYRWWPKEHVETLGKVFKELNLKGMINYEQRFQRKNQEPFWVEVHNTLVRDNGKIKYYLGNWVDITERKKMEAELKRYSEHLQEMVKEKSRDLVDSEERYRRLTAESPQAIHTHCEGKFVYANAAAVKLFGAERPEQLIGKPVTDFTHPDYRDIAKERIRQVNEENVAAPYLEMKFLRLDGTALDVAVVAIPTTYQGKPAVQVVTQDITERKKMDKMRDQFISAVTHELRTPLVSIKGFVDLAVSEGPENISKEVASDLQVVKRNTDRLLGLVNDLLDVSRMQSGRLQLNPQPIDFRKVVEECIEEIQPLVADLKVSLRLEAREGKLPIQGDEVRLTQVLMNLLSNATKFSPEGGEVTLHVEEENETIKVSVSDNGIGISKEDLPRVFEPFAAIQKQSYVKGTGLGLSISKGIVEAHGGQIWAESPGEGKGATFTFTLPRHKGTD